MALRRDEQYEDPYLPKTLAAPSPATAKPLGAAPAPAPAPAAAPAPAPSPGTYTAQTPQNAGAFGGYDFAAHQGQTFSTANPAEGAKYAVSNLLGGYAPGSLSAQDAAAKLNAQFGSQIFKADNPYRLSYGDEAVDWDPSRGWGSKYNWISNRATPPGSVPGGGKGAAGAPGAPGVGPGGIGAPGQMTGVDGALRDALLALMKRSEPGAIDIEHDPNLASQSAAYSAARQRSAAQERAKTAERAAVEGLNSGGQGSGSFDTALHGIQENAGRDIAGNDAALVGQEVAARRQDLMQSLQLANAIGARDQAAQLQKQLADLDNAYKYAQLGQQNSQFYSQLGQQQSQFNDTYGLNKAQLEQDLNRNSILDLLRA